MFFLCLSLLGEDDPIWLIFFKGVETTNQINFSDSDAVHCIPDPARAFATDVQWFNGRWFSNQ